MVPYDISFISKYCQNIALGVVDSTRRLVRSSEAICTALAIKVVLALIYCGKRRCSESEKKKYLIRF